MTLTPHLFFVANTRMPTEKAEGIMLAKTCEQLGNLCRTTLILPQRIQSNPQISTNNIFDYYQIKKTFSVQKLPSLDLIFLKLFHLNQSILIFLIQDISFSLSAFIFTFGHQYVYTRSKSFAFLRCLFQKPVVLSVHDSSRAGWFNRLLARRVSGVVVTTKSIQSFWDQLGAHTVLAPNAISPEFLTNISKPKARAKLNLVSKKPLVVYTGNLYPHKGIDTLIESAKLLPEINFYLVGGSHSDNNITGYQTQTKSCPNIIFPGYVPHHQVPLWLKSADLLVLPNSKKHKDSRAHSSPMKLFEYLASGTPVIASNVPTIREFVTREHVTFFEPDNPQDLAQKISYFLAHSQESKKPKAALDLAKTKTWEKRAERIFGFVSSSPSISTRLTN